MSLPEVHLAGGTCAEAVRLAPVAAAMRAQGLLEPVLLASGTDVSRAYIALGLASDVTLPTADSLSAGLAAYDKLWAERTPAAVVVRGDNLAAALAAYWRRIPVLHLDAGQRSGTPETDAADSDRRLLTQVATVHLAAAPLAAMNLLDESVVAGDILLTGGTAVDAANMLAARIRLAGAPRPNRVLLVGVGAAHDKPVREAMLDLTARHFDLDVIGARTPSPDRVKLVAAADVVLTDDFDLAEEALAAGVPVLVPGEGRGLTEALHTGSAKQVDPEVSTLVREIDELLASRLRRDSMGAIGSPYGDGLAAGRVAQATAALLGRGQFPDPMPARPPAGVTS
ncbi:UDP-N-acetylglucosamine 2-epimerase (non-hydrolyzing) [Paractinoplanes ferrugineus]|uniref:UDP-N-acetylglucosamine 2-epimerase (non-hydrolyzing) n=1 Tax=Paractinoplanes ferrugineus TaxID=113564 RepID=A0A919IZM3_9ACTN|nr:UDP-N-acetylglucosamine 2-epimerase [Actinoplanes ferrugineus]GIE12041.1 UDP-N-acetyl glucosamine 2-epimerase [Actinoplanes ferrugineus]